MKLSISVLAASALLFTGIMASPIAVPSATESSAASNYNETISPSGNSTDISMEGATVCIQGTKNLMCYGGTYKKCVKHRSVSERTAPNTCGFWCNKFEKIDDCGFNKLKYNYHPDWSCKEARYDC
ncbi:putative secreted protein [Wickerhamomyces ciferrii]|uniref:Secreted protein n=1 Tax=Wickerhamomyces ciferrii (strain ATCC 14091 / BCRC 22168 / CBS 111 / JCM 3599 / NBRC 0793 / NRRL Y-1031 F-60-10) TaxID=1206466 RepID=K0KTN2_WICCF|nr:uncharacterized protein BN7_6124 [Wickerhamomyces ciferrii]CCH46531.1 putative secreted protein [Wickerhamomyces ciferrii]